MISLFLFFASSVLANITLLVEAITIAVNATLACVTKGYYIKNVFYSRRPPISFNPGQSLTQFQKIEDEQKKCAHFVSTIISIQM
jgi:hypothetical protein